jgi:hypothetical protein
MILIALSAGGVAAVGTASMLPETAPVEQTEGASTLRALESLRAEVRRLSDEQASLQVQVRDLDLHLSAAPPATTARAQPEPLMAVAPELVELRQQVAQLSARVGGGEVGEPMVMQTVSAALEQIREEEDVEREEARREARQEREADRLVELTEQLTLDGFQQGRMSELIAEYGESSTGIIDDARENSDWGGIRGAFTTLHGEIDGTLAGFLTPAQLEELEQLGGARALNSSGWGNWGTSSSSSTNDS